MGIVWVVSKKNGIEKMERLKQFGQESSILLHIRENQYAVFMTGEPLSDHFELCPRCYSDKI